MTIIVTMNPTTKYASISSLKAKLSQYLDAVRRGEEIIVTDRGRPIARVAPIRGLAEESARRDELIRSGRLRPPRRDLPSGFWDQPRPSDPEGRSLFALLEEREEGR
jgi:prevent-host-death family protein